MEDFSTADGQPLTSVRRAKAAPFLAVAVALLILATSVPFRSAITLGGDEGMELCKGLLMCRQPSRVQDMWNDQPLAYSIVLGKLFSVFGSEAWPPRVLTLVATGALLLSMIALLPRRATLPVQVSCVLFFLTWQAVPELSMSAMCELPAQAIAVTAAAVLGSGRRPVTGWRCALSGLLMATAIHVKLTACIVLPALVATAWASGVRRPRFWTVWVASGVGWFALCARLLPVWSWDLIWNSHFEAEAALGPSTPADLRFAWISLLETPAPLLAASVAIVAAVRRRVGGRQLLFPLTLLATAVIVHSFHRPWWWYYHIHFAVPLSMLGATGCGELWKSATRRHPEYGQLRRLPFVAGSPEVAATVGMAVVALWASFQLLYFIQEVRRMGGGLQREDAAIFATVRQYKSSTLWVFARGPGLCYAFHEGLLVPPELIILSKKRFWAGRITEADVLRYVERYQPGLLFLPKQTERMLPGWESFLAKNYTFVHEHPLVLLFVHNRLAPGRPVSPAKLVRQFGL